MAEARSRGGADWSSAAIHFGAAAALQPSDPTARYNAGGALVNLRRELLQRGPQGSGGSGKSAVAAAAAAAADAAMAFEEAVALRPSNVWYLGSAGLAHAMAGDSTRARERLETVLATSFAVSSPPDRNIGKDGQHLASSAAAESELHMYLGVGLESTATPWLAIPHFTRVLLPLLQPPAPERSLPEGDTQQAQQQQQMLRHAALLLAKLLDERSEYDHAQVRPTTTSSVTAAAPTFQNSEHVFTAAVDFGLWVHPLQRPGYVAHRTPLSYSNRHLGNNGTQARARSAPDGGSTGAFPYNP